MTRAARHNAAVAAALVSMVGAAVPFAAASAQADTNAVVRGAVTDSSGHILLGHETIVVQDADQGQYTGISTRAIFRSPGTSAVSRRRNFPRSSATRDTGKPAGTPQNHHAPLSLVVDV